MLEALLVVVIHLAIAAAVAGIASFLVRKAPFIEEPFKTWVLYGIWVVFGIFAIIELLTLL